MAVNYASKYSNIIDEKFALGALTHSGVNSDYDFTGAKTVYVYTVPTVAMGDYAREGENRYGTPAELDNFTQQLELSMDRSFTFSIDRGNYADTEMAMAAGLALKRQIDQEVLPEIDKHRLLKMYIAGTHGSDNSLGAYEAILKASAKLTNDKVRTDGRVIFMSADFYTKLKQDSNFVRGADSSQAMLTEGSIAKADGMDVYVLPGEYLPFGCEFIIAHPDATVAPQKLAEYKVHDNPPGMNGWLVEGRVYYDAFVLNMKKDAIYSYQSGLGVLSAASEAGSAAGSTLITAAGAELAMKAGVEYYYKIDTTAASVTFGEELSGFTKMTESSIETASTAGKKLVVAAAVDGKAVASSGEITVVVK